MLSSKELCRCYANIGIIMICFRNTSKKQTWLGRKKTYIERIDSEDSLICTWENRFRFQNFMGAVGQARIFEASQGHFIVFAFSSRQIIKKMTLRLSFEIPGINTFPNLTVFLTSHILKRLLWKIEFTEL